MYRALYRKWRPQKFSDVVGQEAITTALSNQILADKVGHAYMFTGTRGTGKTTCAKLFSKAINCENPDGAEPCGQCVPCLGLEDGSILDVIEIDAASNNGVDDIRELREETAYRPSRCQYKVYIIDEVHMLSTQAFNALLKIMEEPPSHVVFILATTEIHKVPATILSRCQRYDFVRIPAEKMAQRLLYVAGQEEINLTDEGADLIARLADGALRDALSLLDTCAGTGEAVDETLVRRMAGVADKGYLFQLSDAVQQQDVQEVLALVASLREKSIDVKRLTEELVAHYRNLLLAMVQSDGALLESVPADERQKYCEAAPKIGETSAIVALRRLASAMDKMGRSPDPRVELELALFDIANVGVHVAPVPVMATAAAAKAPSTTASAPVTPVPSAPPAVYKPATAPVPTVSSSAAATPAEKPPVTAPAKEALEFTQPQEGQLIPFEPWQDVISSMFNIDRMLHSYMKNSNAFFDGKRVLIDGGDMFLSYMREYEEASDKIKKVMEDVTGRRYAIGPYTANKQTSATKKVTAQDTLQEWEAMGVPVEYE